MTDPSENALFLLAVLVHLFFGYLLQYRGTKANIKTLRRTPANEVLSPFTQEILAFIFFPILGYCTLIFFRDAGLWHGITFKYIIIQCIAFIAYFQSRKRKYGSSLLINMFRATLMIWSILSCISLLFSLFSSYLACITFGWVFIILPFCGLAYYALLQVIAFQFIEITKIIQLVKSRRLNYSNKAQMNFLRSDILVLDNYKLTLVLSVIVLLLGIYYLFGHLFWHLYLNIYYA